MTEDAVQPGSSEKTTVFMSDPSVEAERVAQALRAAELHVVDVPLAMLVARVAVQRPRVVILDADAEGALEAVARMRELPDAQGIHVVFCGRPGATLAGVEDALAHEGSGFFPRPVDVLVLVKKIESLAARDVAPSATPSSQLSPEEPAPSPVARVSDWPKVSSRPPPRMSSRPPPSSRPRSSRPPPPSLRGASSSRALATPALGVSRELAELLSRAEEQAAEQGTPSDAPPPSPEEELQAVLPEEVLAALDAPLEDDEVEAEPEGPSRVTTSSGGRSAVTGTHEPFPQTGQVPAPDPRTHDGAIGVHQTQGEPVAAPTSHGATGPRLRTEPPGPPPFADASHALTTPPPLRRPSSVPPPTNLQPPSSFPGLSGTQSSLSTTLGSEALIQQGGMFSAPIPPFGQPVSSGLMPPSPAPSTFETPPAPARGGPSSRRAAPGPYALGPGDAPRVLAQAIAMRQTGALTFETPAERGGPSTVRRVVLREGDVVTAASSLDSESLLAFLGARGDLPRERVEALGGRLPPYGRHAGAALVAQGVLGQEQLWPVLRAHAEFLMGQAMLVGSGTALLEDEPPGRLKTEPSVFGGAPGAETFVEVVRRVIASDEAIRRCGGEASVLGDGARPELLRECGLGAAEADAIRTARGERLSVVVQSVPESDLAPLLYALWLLGVINVVASVQGRAPHRSSPPDAIDEEAVRERIRARIQLVDEGDYFALLGVPRSATGYEVRRAYLDLRRAFEPTRVLTPGLVDLAEDLRRIASVLEEAYEILGDSARRERYRRAIAAAAPSPSDG